MTLSLRRARRSSAAAAGVALIALVAPAASAATAPGQTASARPSPGVSLAWATCGGLGARCATASVPLDWSRPTGRRIDVAVAKSPATDPKHRIGSLFFNFGGPGAPGAAYVEAYGPYLFPVLNQRFDIVGVDPRGTGDSVPLDCKANQETQGVYSKPFVTPDTVDVQALVRKNVDYIQQCLRTNDRETLKHVSTADTARDFDAIRAAVGDQKMTYLGFSYGTFLGATIQSMFPDRTRAVVLDGALDPQQYIHDPLGSLDEQTAGFERAIGRFMMACAADQAGCGFGDGDPWLRTDLLIDKADASPIPASNAPGRPVDGDDVRAALGQDMYATFLWPELAAALAQLDSGDGAGIRAIADGFFGRNEDGSYSPSTDRYFLLSADEQRYPRDVRTFLRAGEESYRNYPHAYWNHGYSELAWGLYPIKAANPFTGPWRTPASAPTTLVVGTRYDPATPYQEAVRLVKQLGNARLLTMNGDGHTAYDGQPADGYNSRCTDAAVEAYLVDLRVPAVGTQCAQDQPAFPAAAAERAKSAAPVQVRERVVRPGTRPMLLP